MESSRELAADDTICYTNVVKQSGFHLGVGFAVEAAYSNFLNLTGIGDIFRGQYGPCCLDTPWYLNETVCEVPDIIVFGVDNQCWPTPHPHPLMGIGDHCEIF